MTIRVFETLRLVKGEDLNHHGTLFAGRASEWMIEAGFIAAASLTDPVRIVCRKVHGMDFRKPVPTGRLLRLRSRIVFAGRTRLVARVEGRVDGDADVTMSAFMTFVHVDAAGTPLPHNLTVEPSSPEEFRLRDAAEQLS